MDLNFSHDGQVHNRKFHLGYNFLVLVQLLVDELQTCTLRETMMEFMEMKNEANSDYCCGHTAIFLLHKLSKTSK